MVYSLKTFEDVWRCLNTWKRWDWYWIQRFGVHRISMNFYLRMFVSLKLWCEGLCSARFTRAWSKAVDFPDADAERLLQNACNTLILGARCQIQIADDSSGEILWWALILERCSVKAPWLVHRGSSTTSRRGSGFFGHGMPWLPWLPWPWHGFGHSVTGSGYIMIHLDVLSCRCCRLSPPGWSSWPERSAVWRWEQHWNPGQVGQVNEVLLHYLFARVLQRRIAALYKQLNLRTVSVACLYAPIIHNPPKWLHLSGLESEVVGTCLALTCVNDVNAPAWAGRAFSIPGNAAGRTSAGGLKGGSRAAKYPSATPICRHRPRPLSLTPSSMVWRMCIFRRGWRRALFH